MTRILPRYIRNRFWSMLLFIFFGIILIFVVVDLVENLDKFLDKKVPKGIIVQYYLFYIPYIVVLSMPVGTLLSTVFTIGTMARDNELIAMKALGFSLYRVMRTLLGVGLVISIGVFILSEGIAAETNKKKAEITQNYLEGKKRNYKKLRDIQIQEPPDKVISMDVFDPDKNIATHVKIITFKDSDLISRIDAPVMFWEDGKWMINKGVIRIFEEDKEINEKIEEPMFFSFVFSPKELLMTQVRPDEMDFNELKYFIQLIRKSGGEVYRWLTDYYLRLSFPLSNIIIVLFSIPLAYNRRHKSLAVGFGLSLVICFFYFGLVKMGQTLGQNGSIPPLIGAWIGNVIMGTIGVSYLFAVRK